MMWDDVFNGLWDEIIKERTKKDMKLEYKFYEKNLAPKWLEGDYDLHIESNRMTMTSKDGKKVEACCHPEDDWRLQVGIDELKDRMAEAKKPREIEVGDVVRFKHGAVDWYYPHTVSDWCKTNHISIDDVMTAYTSDIIFNERDYELEDYRFRVVTVAPAKSPAAAGRRRAVTRPARRRGSPCERCSAAPPSAPWRCAPPGRTVGSVGCSPPARSAPSRS